ncbi:uncharacterized protein YehS (DUF1456 family) [Streptohalobacillus salinus]|uniref:Uncharacterized protein YehS (DUF1456 family) n=1 Tax=Streptohalobacillus salinus TaxID=621096 RepID=A0A2V3WHI5_9BACI|nr:DUF1456 family protein [Streptohalobacillus salinus]PXW91775.1 uncharacterized protein YehS (DUF1456 family) [Streptohalobacillus salinus]
MNNNDLLVRLRYALDLKDEEMVDIFKLGDYLISKETVQRMLTKSNPQSNQTDTHTENEYEIDCDYEQLNAFLDGLIIFKRGQQDQAKKAPQKQALTDENVNNVVLKKVKIALTLTSDDMLQLLSEAGVNISSSELSAVLRKEGHRNYKPCGDRYVRNFLKGLALKYRH